MLVAGGVSATRHVDDSPELLVAACLSRERRGQVSRADVGAAAELVVHLTFGVKEQRKKNLRRRIFVLAKRGELQCDLCQVSVCWVEQAGLLETQGRYFKLKVAGVVCQHSLVANLYSPLRAWTPWPYDHFAVSRDLQFRPNPIAL